MRLDRTSARVIAAVAAVVGAAACSNKAANPMDDGLKTDLAAVGGQGSSSLELAPSSAKNQMVVSPIEGGPESAPKPAAKKVVQRPTPKPAQRLAARQDPAPAPAPTPPPVESAPAAPSPAPTPAPVPQPQEKAAEPPPLPPMPGRARATDRGGATEGQIFHNMPWIRP